VKPTATDVTIIGAGPYGLSLAAHLGKSKLSYRIFGTPMSSWRNHMLSTTQLKSDGFASSLYDPDSSFTLADYCREKSLPYADIGFAVPVETFIAYGLEFRRRFVDRLEETDVVAVEPSAEGFKLASQTGEQFYSKRVVIAAGITHFGFIPSIFDELPHELLTHSSEHRDVTGFKGRRVAVIGAGASAVDLAGVLHEVGAETHLIARRSAIAFHEPSFEPRPLSQRILNPRSGLGLGWRSRLCTDAPLLFYAMPSRLRHRAVQRHLGPAPGWFAKTRFVGRVTSHLGTRMKGAAVCGDQARLNFTQRDGSDVQLEFDHVIAGTGYRVSLKRLSFLHPSLRNRLVSLEDVPVLSSTFESSVPGLYFVGLASSNSFGPLCRFAFGARFTSKRLARHLANALAS
jgi:lysine/ornithine N-monooxygenase